MSGHFFLIRGRQSGLVLDVQGGAEDAGSPVVLWEETGMPNQLWFYDRIDGCIRSKQTGMCLDFDDENTLVINEYCGEHKQLFEYDDGSGCVKNSKDASKVADVAGNETEPGSRVCIWEPTGEENQLFDLEYQPPQYFCIVSKMNGKAMDVKDSDASAGAKVVTWDVTNENNQMFYQDRQGLIRSKLNDFCLDSPKGIGARGKQLKVEPFSKGKAQQEWMPWRDRIVNINNHTKDILEIKKSKDENGAEVVWDHFDNGPNQKWQVVYAD
jgi:hypothetical protein